MKPPSSKGKKPNRIEAAILELADYVDRIPSNQYNVRSAIADKLGFIWVPKDDK